MTTADRRGLVCTQAPSLLRRVCSVQLCLGNNKSSRFVVGHWKTSRHLNYTRFVFIRQQFHEIRHARG